MEICSGWYFLVDMRGGLSYNDNVASAKQTFFVRVLSAVTHVMAHRIREAGHRKFPLTRLCLPFFMRICACGLSFLRAEKTFPQVSDKKSYFS